jgi:hypothetical protein
VTRRKLTNGAKNQNWTTGHSVGEVDSRKGTDRGDNTVDKSQEQLHGAGSVAESLKDSRVEVTETIARPLSKDRDHDDLQEAPAAAM